MSCRFPPTFIGMLPPIPRSNPLMTSPAPIRNEKFLDWSKTLPFVRRPTYAIVTLPFDGHFWPIPSMSSRNLIIPLASSFNLLGVVEGAASLGGADRVVCFCSAKISERETVQSVTRKQIETNKTWIQLFVPSNVAVQA